MANPLPTSPAPITRSVSIISKMILIGFLVLILLIPLALVGGIVSERESRSHDVIAEISKTWAMDQVVKGPILTLPYVNGKTTSYLHILPDALHIKADIKPDIRYRGIYESIVYSTHLHLQGGLSLDELTKRGIAPNSVQWKNATLTIGVSDIKGIQQQPVLTLGHQTYRFVPGVTGHKLTVLDSGMSAPLQLSGPWSGSLPFQFDLPLHGSSTLQFIPVGKDNTLALSSSWASPSFIGGFLPSQRQVTADGFDAQWNVSYFARNFGQSWVNEQDDTQIRSAMDQAQLGVSLISPVDFYQQTTRSVKYGILFLALTFVAYFLFELIAKVKVHPFQYVLIGLALCLFYLLLISLSEVIGFLWAYISASIPTIALITLYTHAITKHINQRVAWVIGSLLCLLYAYLYVLLQLEDLSLLLGSIGLFVALATIMYVSRQIDWYNDKTSAQTSAS